MGSLSINEQVIITQMGFKKDLLAYPRRMEFRGRIYDFIDAGLRCLVKTGGRVCQVITLTDGKSQFFLRSDNNGGLWTLLTIVS